MAKISIIANFWSSEVYIPKLMESVINQTYRDWELICVNDCSPMNDLKVIQRYASKDSRIVVVDNKVNMGISKAKFEGTKHAKGEYLMFIDGDDWLEPEALQRCIEPAEKYGVDMVVMSSRKVLVWAGMPVYKKPDINKDVNRVIAQPELFDKYFVGFFGMNNFPVPYWGKLIRKSVFDKANLKPLELDYSEDLIFNMNLFPYLNSVYMLDYQGYNWRWGGLTSGRLKTTRKRTMKLLNFVLDMYDMRMDVLNKYKYEKGKKYMTIELVNYLVANLSVISNTVVPDDACKEMIQKYIDKFDQNKQYVTEFNDEKFQAFRSKDVNVVYAYCHKVYKQQAKKRLLKKVIHMFIK